VVGIDDVLLLEHKRFEDARGWFAETFRTDRLPAPLSWQQFVQHNHSRSALGVVRGLHYQFDVPMGKLMRVTRGAAYLVALDIRADSASFGEHVGLTLTEQDPCAVWAPAGFARGFQALTDATEVQYACTALYNACGEGAIRWDSCGISWPIEPTIISPKDREAPTLEQYRLTPRFH
jgi:dTDP-4-dehydrorhamnose 3,5-epimerase